MALYCIGDIQGCDAALGRLLDEIGFSPSRDTVYLLGDLVNRGPDSAAVLRRCVVHDGALRCLLGNHDLHLLAAAHGARRPSRRDTLAAVLAAPDRDALLDWLRRQPLARSHAHGGETLLMVHAGVLPAWTPADVLQRADEVHAVLRGPDLPGFLQAMYGNTPDRWSEGLTGADRLRVIVNALTRLRFCSPEGVMDFDSTESASAAPPGLVPWFDAPGRRTASTLLAFGHWSTLGHLNRPDLLGMDTGCVWGGCLSAVRFGATLAERELLQVHCDQAQAPGAP
ncbi:MAG: symmetrical bis(5'-nucleosyl)-tetraphosphatase [Acidovorax sp.]|uniref:symmetrical bis(5'-nucleosyl)-tetraphosphatase n=1 Tax=Acidovorax sp. TaxID=1872122 RepID=UPI0039E33E39